MDMEYGMRDEGTAGEVVTPEEETETNETAAEAEGGKESGTADRSGEKETQSHEERVRYSAARKKGERTGYERASKEINARIAGVGLIDPITNKPISTLAEFEDYGKRYKQQRLEAKAKAENKPLAQVEEEEAAMELLHQRRREDGEREQQEKKTREHREWLRQDAADFAEAFPEVDPVKLENDAKFRKFCGKRFGSEPLAELYGDYLELMDGAVQTAALKKQDKADRGTGAGGGSAGEALSANQRRALEAWNEAYPDMKMTEKEFRERNRR